MSSSSWRPSTIIFPGIHETSKTALGNTSAKPGGNVGHGRGTFYYRSQVEATRCRAPPSVTPLDFGPASEKFGNVALVQLPLTQLHFLAIFL